MVFCSAINKFALQFKPDGPGPLAAFTTSSTERLAIAKNSIDSMIPVIDSITDVNDRISSVSDPSAHIPIVLGIMAFIEQMNTFVMIFKKGGLFANDSIAQNQLAKQSIDTMGPVIDSMKNLVNNISNMEDTMAAQMKVLSVMAFVEKLNDFMSIFKPGGWFSKSSSEQYATAKQSIDGMVPVVDSIKTLASRLNTVEEVGVSLTRLKSVFDLAQPKDLVTRGNDIKSFADTLKRANDTLPSQNKLKTFFDDMSSALSGGAFSKLNEVAEGATKIANSISNINTQLTKLRNENSSTMNQVRDMNKGSGLGGVLSSIGNALSGGKGDGSGVDNSEILGQILEATIMVAENTMPQNAVTMHPIRR
jgi:hypothetical protein